MGILYLDEAGNTGLWDRDQSKLIYGGPYVNASAWSKLNDDIASIQAKYKALILGRFTSGLRPNVRLDKSNHRPAIKPKKSDMREYKTLLPPFLQYVESDIGEQEEIMVFVDDGDIAEKEILRQSVCDSALAKCLGELVVGKYSHYPLLQMADVGVWIIQAHERLDTSRTDPYAKSIQSLYSKLSTRLKEIRL